MFRDATHDFCEAFPHGFLNIIKYLMFPFGIYFLFFKQVVVIAHLDELVYRVNKLFSLLLRRCINECRVNVLSLREKVVNKHLFAAIIYTLSNLIHPMCIRRALLDSKHRNENAFLRNKLVFFCIRL